MKAVRVALNGLLLFCHLFLSLFHRSLSSTNKGGTVHYCNLIYISLKSLALIIDIAGNTIHPLVLKEWSLLEISEHEEQRSCIVSPILNK